uniref:(northern house mosquito) hypothetical protein n=1 Tax=Culex pipiens TaxID=7175 RepID=A0A8D7ZU47_CULPI
MSDNKRERCGPQQSHHRPTVSSTNLPLFFPLFASPSSPGGVPPVRGSQLLVRCVRHPRRSPSISRVHLPNRRLARATDYSSSAPHSGRKLHDTANLKRDLCAEKVSNYFTAWNLVLDYFPSGKWCGKRAEEKARFAFVNNFGV